MNTKKIGVEVVVHLNEKDGKVEIKMSDRVNRSMISAVDAIVGIILDGKGKDLPRKFVENPKGTLIGTQTIKIPEHMLWRPKAYTSYRPRREETVQIPTSAPKVRYNDEKPKLANVVKVTTTAKPAEKETPEKAAPKVTAAGK
jgi:hypothetical protein